MYNNSFDGSEPTEISLRDWFAGLAMQSMIASDHWNNVIDRACDKMEGMTSQHVIALNSYEIADRMLEAGAEDDDDGFDIQLN